MILSGPPRGTWIAISKSLIGPAEVFPSTAAPSGTGSISPRFAHEPGEPAGGVGPGGGIAGLVDSDGERAGDDDAGVGEGADPAPGHRLQQDVARRGRLDRAGVDGTAAGV